MLTRAGATTAGDRGGGAVAGAGFKGEEIVGGGREGGACFAAGALGAGDGDCWSIGAGRLGDGPKAMVFSGPLPLLSSEDEARYAAQGDGNDLEKGDGAYLKLAIGHEEALHRAGAGRE